MEDITLKLPGEDDFFTQEAFKVLRTNLQFCGQDKQVIAVTSCNENEGKTTVSLQLARSLSELGKRVLVIDADMRKSVMAGRNTNAKRAIGLSEVLTGMVKLTLFIPRNTRIFRLFLPGNIPQIPWNCSAENTSKHFSLKLGRFISM